MILQHQVVNQPPYHSIFLEEGKDTAMVVEGRWALMGEVASAHVATDPAQFAEPGQLHNNVDWMLSKVHKNYIPIQPLSWKKKSTLL